MVDIVPVESGVRQEALGIERPPRGRIAREIYGTVELPVTLLWGDRLARVRSISVGDESIVTKPTETVVTGNFHPQGEKSEHIRVISGWLAPPRTRYKDRQYPHRRSYNLMYPDEEQQVRGAEEIHFEGLDAVFSGISFKGAMLPNHNAYIERSPNHISGIGINGLLTRDTAEAAVENARRLRALGITSEVFWRAALLDQLPNPKFKEDKTGTEKEFLTQPEFTQWLLERWKRDDWRHKISGEDMRKAREYLQSESSDFVVLGRATTVPFRLSDLYLPFQEPPDNPVTQAQEFVYMMNHMISHLNRSREGGKKFKPLSVPHDAQDFKGRKQDQAKVAEFFDYFANNLGQQIGILHANGGAHNFFHSGNILGDGGMCDFDSMSWDGNDIKMKRDISSVLKQLFTAGQFFEQAGYMAKGASMKMGRDFLRTYLHTRFGDDIKEYIKEFRRELRPTDHPIIASAFHRAARHLRPLRRYVPESGEFPEEKRIWWMRSVLAD